MSEIVISTMAKLHAPYLVTRHRSSKRLGKYLGGMIAKTVECLCMRIMVISPGGRGVGSI
jgi:hypothetical protein